MPPAEPLRIPLHLLVRIWTGDEALRFADLDTDWVREEASQQLPCQTQKDGLVLTAPGAASRDFLAQYGDDDRAHSEMTNMERVPPLDFTRR